MQLVRICVERNKAVFHWGEIERIEIEISKDGNTKITAPISIDKETLDMMVSKSQELMPKLKDIMEVLESRILPLSDVEMMIIDLLRGRSTCVKFKEIASELAKRGIDETKIKQALQNLKRRGEIYSPKYMCYTLVDL